MALMIFGGDTDGIFHCQIYLLPFLQDFYIPKAYEVRIKNQLCQLKSKQTLFIKKNYFCKHYLFMELLSMGGIQRLCVYVHMPLIQC